MNINDYILKEIKALSPDSSVSSALNLCEHFPITHIPVVKDNKLIGCFAEDDIQTIENEYSLLNEYLHLIQHFHANKKSSLLELLALFAENDCNIIPVLDEQQNYVGYYDLRDILDLFADSPFMHNDNVTLIVAKSKVDFSMSQVSQIVESNKAKLLGLYVSRETVDEVEVTLKISSEEMNEIIQTFRRYDYSVISQLEDDMFLEELKDRANYFKKYLDM
ncbi:CBS domain-containing protein [Tenacibaculum skagerrakense]|uniref:CBS domain-containing protein n=1 Tax=Tenacibaculum skagerrakense TaxID=186571 RepID=A0A4R2NUJ8_9FLAO|nr:CBS domain-containing protein [Tenacibaculum skagerrakense]TCP25231.1 CBS domain-containing protein [Tenacibaculum skagerrakense]